MNSVECPLLLFSSWILGLSETLGGPLFFSSPALNQRSILGIFNWNMLFNNLVNYTIFLGLHWIHDEVKIQVLLDLLDLLAGVLGQNGIGHLSYSEDLPGMNIDVGSLP